VLALAVSSLGVSAIQIPVSWAETAREATSWDVSNTGQPFRDVEFNLTEGTWMSVDVSPDGNTVAFDLLGDIYTIPAAGGTATLIQGGAAMQRDPRFSPDGKKLLYISDASGGDNAWMSDIDGTNAQQITTETINSITGPTWGPRGEYIAAARLFSSATRILRYMGRLWVA